MVDNAAAAVARMIMAAPATVPMEQVLPVLLSALPLKADRSENEAVYTCLLGLIHLRHPEALRTLDSILGKNFCGVRGVFLHLVTDASFRTGPAPEQVLFVTSTFRCHTCCKVCFFFRIVANFRSSDVSGLEIFLLGMLKLV